MALREKTIYKSSKYIIKKMTHRSGPFKGDYYYLVLDKDGNFIENICNRMISILNKYMAEE